ncbi:MAG: CDP-alcohol phosphatidyltransferase family protein [Candidatus Paceibacterota bacterium]
MKKLFGKAWTFLIDRFTGRNAHTFEVRDRIMTRANMMTMSGIVLTTFYLAQYYYGFWLMFIPVVCPLIAGTDGCDGFLADYYNEHSKWGKIMDPVRDRFFTFVLLGNIWVIGGKLVLAPLLAVIGFELLIGIGALILSFVGDVPNVHCVGKIRAAVQWTAGYLIIAQYYWLGFFFIPIAWLVWVMALASVFAYLFYSYRYLLENIEYLSF